MRGRGFVVALLFVLTSSSWAAPEAETTAAPAAEGSEFHFFSTELRRSPTRERWLFLPQFVSFLLPGFDQWWEGQYLAASTYTGTYLVATMVNQHELDQAQQTQISISDLYKRNDHQRAAVQANQVAFAMQSFSAYASFRSAVRAAKANGKFQFLEHEETLDQVLAAPFHFSYLKRRTSLVPLGVLAGLSGLALASYDNVGGHYTGSDFVYTMAGSYTAGTHEEALFRGWLMPLQMHYFNSEFWSNTSTAVMFGLVHLDQDLHFPIIQAGLGWYLGWVTQRNEWTLGESIFIHAWWDVIAFTTSYLAMIRDPNGNHAAYLPPIQVTF